MILIILFVELCLLIKIVLIMKVDLIIKLSLIGADMTYIILLSMCCNEFNNINLSTLLFKKLMCIRTSSLLVVMCMCM